MFDLRNQSADGAIFFDRQHRGAASAIVGHEDIFAGGINGEMARAGVAGGLLVYFVQLTALNIQCERCYTPALFAVKSADLVDGVEVFSVWVDLEKRRVRQAVHGVEFLQTTLLQVELKQVNAFPVGGRVATETDQGPGRRGARLAKRGGEAKRDESGYPEKRVECHAPNKTETRCRLQGCFAFHCRVKAATNCRT